MLVSLLDMFVDYFKEDLDPLDFELVCGHVHDVGPFEIVLETLLSYQVVVFPPVPEQRVRVQPFSTKLYCLDRNMLFLNAI